mgnify:CR=1 FL=1
MAALFDPLLIAIVAPLVVALAIGCGLPKRWSVRLAYAGFGIPLLMALHVWWHYSAQTPVSGYAFLRQYSTGLDELGDLVAGGLAGGPGGVDPQVVHQPSQPGGQRGPAVEPVGGLKPAEQGVLDQVGRVMLVAGEEPGVAQQGPRGARQLRADLVDVHGSRE